MFTRAALFAVLVGCSGSSSGPVAGADADGAGQAPTADTKPAPGPATPAADPSAPPATTSDLFSRTFGKIGDPPVIFLHGGPGANDAGFEASGADLLAAHGFFVVTYDQRGGGRSPKGTAADYSFKGSSADLAALIPSLKLSSPPVLIANSFGGSVALHFMKANPGMARSVILLDSPLDWPKTYFTIIQKARAVYHHRLNLGNVDDMDDLEAKMFPRGLSGPYTYGAADIGNVTHAMTTAALIFPLHPTASALKLEVSLALSRDANTVVTEVGEGYQANDKVGYADFVPLAQSLAPNVYGIYGSDDQIFDEEQLARIRATLTPDRFVTVEGASHFPFIDQPETFVTAAVGLIARMK